MKIKNKVWINLIIAFLSVGFVAVISTLLSNRNSSWYELLLRPSEWPPKILFPIIWSLIYFIIAVVLFIQLQNEKIDIDSIAILSFNGLFNILWCLCFFTLNSTLWGLILIILNLIFSVLLALKYYKLNKNWGYIISIYPLWISFAFVLNLAVWILN